MSSWRRRFRRKQRPFAILAMVSLFNLFFPHPALAAPANRDRTQIMAIFDKAKIFSKNNAVPVPAVASPIPYTSPKPPTPQKPPAKQTKRLLRVVATAYTSSPDETDSDPFTTASGAKTGDGVIAVNGLPFGTKVKIPDVYGDKEFVVLDRMAPRHGRNRIDIWMPSKHQAKNWGVRTVMVEIQ